MKIIRAKDYKDMSRKAANIISAQVIMKPNCVLGLAQKVKQKEEEPASPKHFLFIQGSPIT